VEITCGWFATADHQNRGLFAGWEFDGRVDAEVKLERDRNTLRLEAPILDLHHPVASGEEITLPAAFLGLYEGDWDEAGFRTQRFVEAALAKAPPDPAAFPFVAWDSWGCQQNLNEDLLRRNADLAAGIGIELFTVDLGWARSIGDWRDDPAKFPTGLRRISDRVHELGMRFGLHLAFAEAAPDSPVLREYPDWRLSKTYGYFGAVSLCLAHKPVQEWITKEIIGVIDDYDVDWILQDGEQMVKQCTKTTHTHHPLDSNYAASVEGLNAVVEAVQKARPKVAWENCADGGTIMTFNMVKNYVTSITNDASGVEDSRVAAYGATYAFPPRYTNRYMGEDRLDTYTTRSFMLGGPWIFMNKLESLSRQDLQLAADEIANFKRMRQTIRDGQV
jgi:alpha-galactosidase